MKSRYSGHRSKPPPKMASDAAIHKPFRIYFPYEILFDGMTTKGQARKVEKQLIEDYDSVRKRYNDLDGDPTHSRKFWFLHSRGLLGRKKKTK